jgi:hypothetical protein
MSVHVYNMDIMALNEEEYNPDILCAQFNAKVSI